MDGRRDLLLEIGCEEIPSSFILPALERMEAVFREFCAQNRIEHGEVKTCATPRRLALTAAEVAETQAKKVEEIKGPPAKIAVDENGKFTQAAAKFAESRGGKTNRLIVKDTGKGEYVFLVTKEKGRKTKQALPELPVRIIKSLIFPKSMRWDVRRVTFARPIRWIMLLFGDSPVKVDFENIPSGGFTYGNRYFGDKKIKIGSIAEYFEKLEAAGVMVDHRRRREAIRERVIEIAGGKPHITDSLLNDVNFLVEYPYVAAGSFPEEFTELPPEVLIICIEKNQHYFPVADAATGRMLPRFVVVMNVPLTENPTVIRGYEKVLNSRLKDAKFFYDTDIRTPLRDRVESLKRITFQEKLGSLWDKTERVERLVETLGTECQLGESDIKTARKAAHLMKADLTTQMVFEYTEIQGTVGKYYALQSGEAPAVAQAIEEHYMPRFADDELPASKAGALLALADKIDTIVGYFSVGLIPTGSADPFQLRRQALGIIRILEKYELPIKLAGLFKTTINNYPTERTTDTGETAPSRTQVKYTKIHSELMGFFRTRYSNYMESEGFSYDVVNAILDKLHLDYLIDIRKKAEAIKSVRDESQFQDMLEVIERISNILSKSAKDEIFNPEEIKIELFEKDEEKNLYEAAQNIAKSSIGKKSYIERIRELYVLTSLAHAFFENVHIMAENSDVKANRLALATYVLARYSRIADFKQIVKKSS